MTEPRIEFSTSRIELGGKLFEGDAAVRIKGVMAAEVRRLGLKGQRLVKRKITPKNGTGYTASHIEMYQEFSNSLFAVVRMEPGLEREPGSELYPAARRPYIVNAVLASGMYGTRRRKQYDIVVGRKGARKRVRFIGGVQRQTPLDMYAKAAIPLRRDAKNFRAEVLAKELA